MDTEFLEYIIKRVSRTQCKNADEMNHAIEEALKDRLNEMVRLVQDYEINKSYRELLQSIAYYHTVTLRQGEDNVPALLRPQA